MEVIIEKIEVAMKYSLIVSLICFILLIANAQIDAVDWANYVRKIFNDILEYSRDNWEK